MSLERFGNNLDKVGFAYNPERQVQVQKGERPPVDILREFDEIEKVDLEKFCQTFVKQFSKEDKRGVKVDEADFQSKLVRILKSKTNVGRERFISRVKTRVSELLGSRANGEEIRDTLKRMSIGAEYEADKVLPALQQSFENSYDTEDYTSVVYVHPQIDARNEIDMVQAILKKSSDDSKQNDAELAELNFIQAKSYSISRSVADTIHRTHEEFVRSLRSSKEAERVGMIEDLKKSIDKKYADVGTILENYESDMEIEGEKILENSNIMNVLDQLEHVMLVINKQYTESKNGGKIRSIDSMVKSACNEAGADYGSYVIFMQQKYSSRYYDMLRLVSEPEGWTIGYEDIRLWAKDTKVSLDDLRASNAVPRNIIKWKDDKSIIKSVIYSGGDEPMVKNLSIIE